MINSSLYLCFHFSIFSLFSHELQQQALLVLEENQVLLDRLEAQSVKAKVNRSKHQDEGTRTRRKPESFIMQHTLQGVLALSKRVLQIHSKPDTSAHQCAVTQSVNRFD